MPLGAAACAGAAVPGDELGMLLVGAAVFGEGADGAAADGEIVVSNPCLLPDEAFGTALSVLPDGDAVADLGGSEGPLPELEVVLLLLPFGVGAAAEVGALEVEGWPPVVRVEADEADFLGGRAGSEGMLLLVVAAAGADGVLD